MSKFELRIKAQELRRKGFSIRDISKQLDVSKSSASIWCQNLILTTDQQSLLQERAIAAGHRGRLLGAGIMRERKLQMIKTEQEKALRDIGRISKRDLLLLITAL